MYYFSVTVFEGVMKGKKPIVNGKDYSWSNIDQFEKCLPKEDLEIFKAIGVALKGLNFGQIEINIKVNRHGNAPFYKRKTSDFSLIGNPSEVSILSYGMNVDDE